MIGAFQAVQLCPRLNAHFSWTNLDIKSGTWTPNKRSTGDPRRTRSAARGASESSAGLGRVFDIQRYWLLGIPRLERHTFTGADCIVDFCNCIGLT